MRSFEIQSIHFHIQAATMKCFLSLFLSLFLSECRTFINMDLNSNTDTADVKTRKNMKPTKGRDSKTNSKVANDDEGMTLSYSIIQIPVFLFI